MEAGPLLVPDVLTTSDQVLPASFARRTAHKHEYIVRRNDLANSTWRVIFVVRNTRTKDEGRAVHQIHIINPVATNECSLSGAYIQISPLFTMNDS